MRAELLVKLPMLSFAEQMQINLAQDRPVLIRIAHRVFRAVPVRDPQPVIEIAGRVCHASLEKSVAMNFLRLDRLEFIRRSLDASPARAGGGPV